MCNSTFYDVNETITGTTAKLLKVPQKLGATKIADSLQGKLGIPSPNKSIQAANNYMRGLSVPGGLDSKGRRIHPETPLNIPSKST